MGNGQRSKSSEHFLVTGAYGCIGAWTVKQLVDEKVQVWAYDLPGNPHRLRLIMDDAALEQVHFVTGDITDQALFERTVVEQGITTIIHLAALQVPFVRADPVGGARVNVVGTAVVLEAAKRHLDQIDGLVYASSIGVYGPAALYPEAPLAHTAPLAPTNLYGVYKQANEGMAQVYWAEDGVRSIGLRPYVVYGPGRDQGMTSTPTKAMLAAAVQRGYHISYGGAAVFQYAPDVAAIFIAAARAGCDGATVYNIGGSAVTMDDIIAAIQEAAPDVASQITSEATPLPHPPTINSDPLDEVLGPVRYTDLHSGVHDTIEHFRMAARDGRIDVARILA
ncbi:MAG: NAD(P)-dependent oxidoreductase [Herpetosiphonaceae bacterium]|nr:NAD(P)-dependent oxidoreductase [Herpetosiphonaceae bacterium]